MKIRRAIVSAAVLLCAAPLHGQTPPQTPQRPVTDGYFGRKVVDPYRWLENWDDPEVRAWTDAQNGRTRAMLDSWPSGEAVRRRVQALGTSASARWTALTPRPAALFALKYQPPRNQPQLVVLPPTADPAAERVIVDPNRIDPSGATTIDFYEPSRDGRLVAVSLSAGGTEDGTVHLFNVADGRELPDRLPRVNGGTAGGSVAWDLDGEGLFYTRYPRGNERPAEDRDFYQQVYFHKLGAPTETDTYALGRDFPRIAETELASTLDGKYLLAEVKNGDGGEVSHYVRGPDRQWRRLTQWEDHVRSIVFGADDELYALSHKNAPHGAIVKLGPEASSIAGGRTIYRANEGDIVEIVATAGRLLVNQVVGGPHQLHVMDLNGGGDRKVPGPPVSSISQLVALPEGDVLFLTESYLEPPAWRRLRNDGTVVTTPMAVTSTVDFSDIAVERAEAVSKDGTKVPLSILHRKNIRLDGSNPTVLYGYGGFGISLSPYFSRMLIVWLEQGGVYAVANLRGGGELGEPWHEAGKLTNKQNVFDDFAACASLLVQRRYTNPAKLAFWGGSNGGLLMGAVLTEHPALARAVVSQVGIYDMLRFELFPNGVFNATEFGSVKEPAQFEALFGYSPYQHVVNGTKYPAVLLLSGTNDPRVNPGDSRRFAARLQAATSSGLPVLLRTSGGGHIGNSLSEGLAETADIYSFLFWQLGVDYHPVVSPMNSR
ncbi:MAG TPA: prolyl oligopeptidase family serine peptidase [Vicinamibacterales bacterium]|jgi:prolyl oligopeptidase|nr:prolyl oligopeptidase family serine peptidase [Vicinamibacterales bacterium]